MKSRFRRMESFGIRLDFVVRLERFLILESLVKVELGYLVRGLRLGVVGLRGCCFLSFVD